MKLENFKRLGVEGIGEEGGKRAKQTARYVRDCLGLFLQLLQHLEKRFLLEFVYSHTYFFIAFYNNFISIYNQGINKNQGCN